MFTAPAESSYRWRTPEQESARKSSSGYSTQCSLQNRAVWGWVCRSAVRSLRPMMAGCGLPRTNPRAPSFSLCCSPTVRRLLVLHDESDPRTSWLVRAPDSEYAVIATERDAAPRVSECRPKPMKQSSCAAFGLADKQSAERGHAGDGACHSRHK